MVKDPRAASEKLRAAFNDKRAAAESIASALAEFREAFVDIAINTVSAVELRGVGGAPDWTQLELAVWQAGEDIRGATGRLKGSGSTGPIVDQVLAVVATVGLGKGRQSFVALASDLGGEDAVRRLTAHLDDDEVNGAIVGAMVKRKVAGYSARVAPLTARPHPPLTQRNARKYLKLALG